MKTFIFLFLSVLSIGCKAQSLKYKEVRSSELNQFAGSIIDCQRFELKENFVKTIITSNPSGSAGNPETGEVSDTIYISNCQSGELLICKLFIVENLINIKVGSVTENNSSIIVRINHGNYADRKSSDILIPR
ncbi:hypothetical protein [Flavobacterium sp. K5-23]|uniref:hypothetical protein n=1 Tax=Flavobacterium sp. K5-23 TaxID=2746225 RepID=UPI00200E618A|nr:hypothetical protein [Flavobacterium sp. K5-23]UQD55609.1 hypothetical protein FLAK523_04045 [Flavobacterium sp. K5-23]